MTFNQFARIVAITGFTAVSCVATVAQTSQDPIAVARSAIKADRESVVRESMQLTSTEAEKFWPLYNQYRADMDKIGGNLLKMVQEYATVYPNVADDRAQRMLSTLLDLEKERASTRAAFLKKSEKILPASKALRLAQVESRLDLALQLTLASRVPLTPIEGTLMPDSGAAIAAAPGRAGGLAVHVVDLKATVTAIDPATRKVTLMSPDGIKETVKAGPDVINFDQIHVGDELRVRATQELVVHVGDTSEPAGDEAATMVKLAPEGAKPGGVAAQVVRVVGTVTAIDPEKHTATLKFEDGSSRTFPVRRDVQLGRYKVGDQVVFQVTEAIGLSIEKP
jgi:hypothetical protein